MQAHSFLRSLGLALAAGMSAAAPRALAQEAVHQHHHQPGMPTTTDVGGSVPLYDNLGRLTHKVSTGSETAQRYFDQGLRLTYAFNHDEAIASFTQAAREDSTCAMCWWGIAYAMGPNINAPMDTSAYRPAYAAIQRAVQLAPKATPYERDMIQAMATRYAPEPVADRAGLDSAYNKAMRVLAKKYSKDPETLTLYAESQMNLSPWNYWENRGTKARPGTQETVKTLEQAIARTPDHPGACHFYIHIVEASTTPERAVPCADRLAKLMPGAGHLVHMPSHIYMRVGRYDLVADHNHEAVAEDQSYIQDRKPTGFYKYTYYPHNWHMLWMGLIQLGRGAEAISASRELAKVVPVDVVATVPPLETYFPPPYWTLVRFGKYDEMLAEPEPAAPLKYTRAMWRYSRGIAFAGKGRTAEAQAELDSVAAAAAATPKEASAGINSQKALLELAERHLAGRLALAKAEVSKPSYLEIVADVLSADATQIKSHMPVRIENWGGDGVLTARVRTVSPQAFTKVSALGVEEQRVNVIADLDKIPENLGDNYRVDVRIVLWEGSDVLRVPSSALFRSGDAWNVYVVEGGKARSRNVEVGHRSPSFGEVLSGLNEGETVILHPPTSVSEGSRVTSQ